MHISAQQQRNIEANRQEYGDRYQQLTFLDSQSIARANARRAELLASLEGGAPKTTNPPDSLFNGEGGKSRDTD